MPQVSLLRFEWKPQDLWVGVFWKHIYCSTDDGDKVFATDMWICIVPCVPLRVTLMWPIVIDMTKE